MITLAESHSQRTEHGDKCVNGFNFQSLDPECVRLYYYFTENKDRLPLFSAPYLLR